MIRWWAYIHSMDRTIHLKRESIPAENAWPESDLVYALNDLENNSNILGHNDHDSNGNKIAAITFTHINADTAGVS